MNETKNEFYELIETTYELTFYDLNEKVDSIQQYRTETEAREAMKLFDEPASVELYSMITLTKTEWLVNNRRVLLDVLSFCAKELH